MKHYRFFMHFNRINMQRGLPNVWSVHFRGTCYSASKVKLRVPIETRYVPQGRQPRATLRGWATTVRVNRDRVIIE